MSHHTSISPPYKTKSRILALAAVLLLLCIFTGRQAVAETTEADDGNLKSSDIQKTIAILEDDTQRAEVVKLLKLMAVMQEEGKTGPTETPKTPESQDLALQAQAQGVKEYLSGLVRETWRDLSVAGAGLRKTGREVREVMTALARPEAILMWRSYTLKIFIWGLACLVATFIIMHRYKDMLQSCCSDSFFGRFKSTLKYLLIVTGPNLVLILSILAIPRLSTTAPGVTVDMATGFDFLHSLIQHFFVSLSVLYIALQLAKALLSPGPNGRSTLNIHPVLARHFFHSWRVFVTYIASFIFIKYTFLEHFTAGSGSIYSICLGAMTIPIPIYLTIRILKLKSLVHIINEAESSAGFMDDLGDSLIGTEEETEENRQPDSPAAEPLDYRADMFIKKHWSTLALAGTWITSLVSIINPASASELFAGRLTGTIALIMISALLIKSERVLMLHHVPSDTAHGRRLLLNVDGLANAVVWPLAVFAALGVWGLPLSSFFESPVTLEILSRGFAILVTVAAVSLFVKFSRLATDWLLSVPNFRYNRDWRTVAPLLLTAVRALAVFIGAVVVLERLGVNIGPILAGAGILGLGVGMGAQSLVKDIINGISILMMDTLSVGDYVSIGGLSGTVETVGLRSIRLRDSYGNLAVVPNSSVSSIVNMTRDYSQDLVEFVVPYDADPDQMLKMASEVAYELSNDKDWAGQMTAPINLVGVTAFDPNGTTIRLKVNTTAGSQWAVGRELKLRLKRRMLNDGLTSPWFGQNVFNFTGDANYSLPKSERAETESVGEPKDSDSN